MDRGHEPEREAECQGSLPMTRELKPKQQICTHQKSKTLTIVPSICADVKRGEPQPGRSVGLQDGNRATRCKSKQGAPASQRSSTMAWPRGLHSGRHTEGPRCHVMRPHRPPARRSSASTASGSPNAMWTRAPASGCRPGESRACPLHLVASPTRGHGRACAGVSKDATR